jgi:ketosteroid isomerase-like protein
LPNAATAEKGRVKTMTQTTSTNAQTEETRRVVNAAYAAAMSGDNEAFVGLMDPDIILREADALPNAGVHHGVENVLQAIGAVFATFDVANLTIESIVADGEYGIGLITLPIRERPGQTHAVSEVWQVRNGKVVEVRPFYWDTAALQAISH